MLICSLIGRKGNLIILRDDSYMDVNMLIITNHKIALIQSQAAVFSILHVYVIITVLSS